MLPPGVEIGPAGERHLATVVRRWLETYRPSPFARQIATADYLADHERAIRAYLARPGATLTALTDSIDRNLLVAFCAYERPGLLHYLWVRQDARRPESGWPLAQELIRDLDVHWYTHWTACARSVLTLIPAARYTPHRFFAP